MLKYGKNFMGKKYMSDRRNNPWQRERKLHGTIQDAIFGNVDNDFEMNDYKKKSIYLNDLGEENSTDYIHTGYKHEVLYHHNKLHYRCDNFEKNVDILFSGCSMTYGYGVPVELTFPHIVSDTLSYSYSNIGLLSESVSSQVRRTLVVHYVGTQRMRFEQELKVGYCISIQAIPAPNGIPGFNFYGPPKHKRHLLPKKNLDYRLVSLEDGKNG
jgi:hypothetical protein